MILGSVGFAQGVARVLAEKQVDGIVVVGVVPESVSPEEYFRSQFRNELNRFPIEAVEPMKQYYEPKPSKFIDKPKNNWKR